MTSTPAAAAPPEAAIDSDLFGGYEARAIGPAAMSGRIAAVDAVWEDRLKVYVGSASGGVWKSRDGGVTFRPIFDKQPTQSIGAVAIDPSNPKTVWVGTGEQWVRNSVSVGTGVYRTRDGGDTWELAGLPDSEHVSRIAIHPRDGNTVWACATGHLWDSNAERGVFKTTDGGKTWRRVLFVDEETGCADLALDPKDPQILYAGLWQFRRKPWTFTSGGPKSGLFKSADGGETWKQVRRGLPDGDVGRIGLAVAESQHNVVYAVVEAKRSALFRSDDFGESWREQNSSFNVAGRPFYFAYIVVDPKNADRVYKPGFSLTVSEDGGRSFSSIFLGDSAGTVHGDHHALWINPRDPDELFDGTDGGLYHSRDRGAHWRFLASLPLSQFYHVSFDLERPYNVYGGLQDNGTWMGPSRAPGGIGNRHWKNIGGGDGFWAFADPTDPERAYVEYQGGHVSRVHKSTGERKDIQPLPRENEPEFRFNWNTPIHLSPSSPGTLYVGAQFLFRSRDHGESWERLSPDLTTDDKSKQNQEQSGGVTVDNSDAERYTTIFAISESPRNPNLIWVGTDDGNLQFTRDGGRTWTNVVRNVPGVPPKTWVSSVEASHFDEGAAYATFDNHMTGDMKTYVYKTADFGRTWRSLSTPDLRGYAHVVREDLVVPRLLFVGTESGLFVSIEGGGRWARFTGGNFPQVAVRDLAVHPRESDLVIATHGRGIYILDDLTPLRSLDAKVLAQEAALLPARPAVLSIPAAEQRFDADAEYVGRSLEDAAAIAVYQRKRHIFGDLRFEIYDAQGTLITKLSGPPRRGLSRVLWPMRLKPPRLPPAASLVPQPFAQLGPRVPEGTYTVKMVRGRETYTSQVKLVADPRSKATAEDRALQQRTAMRLYKMLDTLTYVVDATVDLLDGAQKRLASAPKSEAAGQLSKLARSLSELRGSLVATREGGMITGEHKLREDLGTLYGAVNGNEGRPTRSQLERMEVLGKKLDRAGQDLEALAAAQLPAINAGLERAGLAPLRLPTRAEWDQRQPN